MMRQQLSTWPCGREGGRLLNDDETTIPTTDERISSNWERDGERNESRCEPADSAQVFGGGTATRTTAGEADLAHALGSAGKNLAQSGSDAARGPGFGSQGAVRAFVVERAVGGWREASADISTARQAVALAAWAGQGGIFRAGLGSRTGFAVRLDQRQRTGDHDRRSAVSTPAVPHGAAVFELAMGHAVSIGVVAVAAARVTGRGAAPGQGAAGTAGGQYQCGDAPAGIGNRTRFQPGFCLGVRSLRFDSPND